MSDHTGSSTPATDEAGAVAGVGTTHRRLSDVASALGTDPPVVFALQREMHDPIVVAYFTVDGEPQSKARPRLSAKGKKPYTPERTRVSEDRIAWLFRQAVGPFEPSATDHFGVFGAFFCGTRQRRDVDNMIKLVLDALNGIAWKDDMQVTEVSGRVVRGTSDARSEILIYRTLAQGAPTKPCEQCGRPYPAYPSQDLSRRFCMAACGYAWRRAQNERTCEHCGGKFQRTTAAKYCSKTCAYTAKHVQLTCTYCGTSFTNARSTARAIPMCSAECRVSHWRERRRRVAAGTCEDCGGSTSKKAYRRCQACHLVALGVGGAA